VAWISAAWGQKQPPSTPSMQINAARHTRMHEFPKSEV
jgi:hypothetical protein